MRATAPHAEKPATETDADRHERARKDIHTLTEHIRAEALRANPPRRLRFSEATIGSKLFRNQRITDKSTGAVVMEHIQYDPGIFWDAPPGAFYAALWHEFGHGEKRYIAIEDADRKTYKDEAERDPKTFERTFLNVKTDIFIDANNVVDRPGVATPYHALYDHYFPREREEKPSPLAEHIATAESPERVGDIAEDIHRIAIRAGEFLFACKHDGFWLTVDARAGIPEGQRKDNPIIADDPVVMERFARIRAPLTTIGDGTKGTPSRSELFNRTIAPEYFALCAERDPAIAERKAQALRDAAEHEDISVEHVQRLADTIRRAAHETLAHHAEVERDAAAAEAAALEEWAAQAAEDAEQRATHAERKRDAARREAVAARRAGKDEETEELVQRANDADAEVHAALEDGITKSEAFHRAAAERSAEAGAKQALADAIRAAAPPPGEPTNLSEALDQLIAAILAMQSHGDDEGPPHAEHTEIIVDTDDPRHPDSPFAGSPAPGGGPAPKPAPPDRAPPGITPEDHAEYRGIRSTIDESALHDIVNGLVRSFAEDRERVILPDLPYGQLPTSRKGEAIRRRYAGEQLPAVREIRKTTERFMGVDIIVCNDHSGSMRGAKERAAKAANLALKHAAYRVNGEIAKRMRRAGHSPTAITRTPPLRYLGILFSDVVKAMNTRGWNEPLITNAATLDDQEFDEEKFAVESFPAYREMLMNGTNDYLAAAHALAEAFGREDITITKPEERVKVLAFLTDGCGGVQWMTELMQYLHGTSENFPAWVEQFVEQVMPGASARVRANIEKYRDQIFAIAIGIPSYPEEEQTFINVYNEGRRPDPNDVRVSEDHHIAIVPAERVAELPHALLRLLRGKFGSPKFRQLRARFTPPTRSRRKFR